MYLAVLPLRHPREGERIDVCIRTFTDEFHPGVQDTFKLLGEEDLPDFPEPPER